MYLFHFIPDHSYTSLGSPLYLNLLTLYIHSDTPMSDNEKGQSPIEVDDVDEEPKDLKPKSENVEAAVPRKRVSCLAPGGKIITNENRLGLRMVVSTRMMLRGN